MKNELALELAKRGYAVDDLGTNVAESCDYPDYAHVVARGVASGKWTRGILVCGTGVGMSIAANRHPGVRAVVCSDEYTARLSRSHNDSNILCLGERVVGPGLALSIVDAWLSEAPSEEARHARRREKIEKTAP